MNIIVNDMKVKSLKEAIVAYFKVLSRHPPGESEKNYGKSP
jgi:hypothetical protein